MDSKPKPVSRTIPTIRIDERDICNRESEELDQIIPADVRERPQRLQLIPRRTSASTPTIPTSELGKRYEPYW